MQIRDGVAGPGQLLADRLFHLLGSDLRSEMKIDEGLAAIGDDESGPGRTQFADRIEDLEIITRKEGGLAELL